MQGARVAKKITDHGRYTINVLTTEGEKDMYLEAQNEQEMDEWYQYINMEILASNVDRCGCVRASELLDVKCAISLQRGERVPTVQVWYKQEHKRYEDSMRLIGFGHSVVVHVIDRTVRYSAKLTLELVTVLYCAGIRSSVVFLDTVRFIWEGSAIYDCKGNTHACMQYSDVYACIHTVAHACVDRRQD
jgi:hypothetical protein